MAPQATTWMGREHRRRTTRKAHKRASSLILCASDLISRHWSPDQIAGVMARIGSGIRVSHQWIYALIQRDRARGDDLWTYCRQPKQRRDQRHRAKCAGLGKIPNRTGIEERPAAVEARLTLDHWESDRCFTAISNRASRHWFERRSGYLLAGRLPRLSRN